MYEKTTSQSIDYLITNCPDCHISIIGVGFLAGFLASGQDFGAHVAALFGPFVVLLGQHRTDQPDDGIPAGEDTDHVGPATHFLIEAFLGYLEFGGRVWL
jgi:hypothetical protein